MIVILNILVILLIDKHYFDSGTPGNLSVSPNMTDPSSINITLNWSQPPNDYSISCYPGQASCQCVRTAEASM